ncbi:chromodomain-helicase-DNA-binding 3 isoform X1, partial [Micractinium conductrix]
FRPPSGAAGPPCSLCKLPTVVQGDAVDCSDDVRREFEGLYSRNFVLHRRCIAWGDDACFKAMRQMRVNQVPPGLMTSFDGAVRSAFLTKCVMCKQTGASAQCAHKQCRKTFHLHCAKGCKLDPDLWELYCPAHGVLDAAGMSKASFYGNAKSQRLRDGGTGKRSFKELHPQEEDEEPRRSTRHADKRVRRGGSDEHSDAEDFMSEESDDDGSGGSRRIRYADHSSGEEDEDGIATRRGRRGKAGKGRVAARQRVLPERQRTKVKSYAEEQEELELKMEAYRAEQATKTGYENTRCEICDAKDCETCGQAAAGGGTRGRKAAAAAADLAYCSVCGGLAHEGCMQAQGDGALKCTLCLAGLADVEAVLGCRLARGADKGDERREYFVKFKEKSYRRCRWLTERATARLAPSQLQRFVRDTRDAPGVEPNVQEQWMQVDRVVATRADPATPGTRQCLVKWRGLEYDKATWEPRDEVEEEAAEALERVGGVSWALGKLTSGMSAILGDEMGLGKTIQTAVFLQLARELKLTTGPVAVVVPLSTFGSWEREMAKYELGVEGDDYKSLKPRFHVMLTTYDVVLRDVGILKRYDWSAVVIDEGHSLKGENSLRAKTLRNLGAPWRMLLTGTPLQNNLRELLNLLAFMADATADDIEQRVNRMADPNPPAAVEGERAEEADEELLQAQAYIRKLHAYLEPRMLRRMKAICLAGQMPPKITRRVPCRMTPLQLQLYTDILAKDFDKVHAMVRNRLEKKSMNNILIRLRQACCHPYLLPGQEPEEYKDNPQLAEEAWRLMVAASGKLTLLQQLLPRLLSEGHRVLVFSQSVEMLDILEDFLHDFQDTSGLLPKAEDDDGAADGGGGDGGALRRVESDVPKEDEGAGSREESPHDAEEEEDFVRGRRGSVIRYFRLDGKSKQWQRQAMMDLFNSINCKVKVMLISTRAGSLGINLQTANTVVLYDPDFNPFVDAQAEGRAHRLGQEETVMVYQMYTASSVEERILELAAKKRKLEELVTRHLGKARDVSDEDIKSSVFYGWGNLMHQAGEDGKAGDVALSDADLARLLDREHVFADDQATGADAATLLGEVRAGAAAALQFDGGDKGAAPADGGATGLNPEMEAALLKLVQERHNQYEAEKAAQVENLGRGSRRARAAATNYKEDDGLGELLSDDDSPEKKKGKRQPTPDSPEYNPANSPGLAKGSGENAQPNTVSDLRYSSDSDSDSGADGVDSPPAAAAVAAVVEVPPPQSLLPAAPAVAVPPPQLLLMHAQAPPSDRKKNKKKNKDKAAVVAAAAAAPPARRQLHTPAMQQLLQQQTAAMHSQLEGVMQATLAMPVQLTFEQVQEALQRAIRTAAAEAVAAAAAQGPLSAADMEALVDAQVAEGQSIARQLHVAHVVAQGQARQEQQARQALQHARARQEQQARQALQQAQARRGKKK